MDVPATLRVLRSLQASGLAWMSRVRSREQVVASVEGHLRALALPAAALPPIVHVAGTKGKGSTCALVESALRAAGLRTGLFTSPHLVCPTERICINGAPVAVEAYLGEFERTLRALRAAAPHGDPPDLPGFTLLLLVAYRLFLAARLDVLVLEVSVGGLLCPTNALPAAQAGTPARKMPAFCAAMAGSVAPSTAMWSMSSRLTPLASTRCSGRALVAHSRPPTLTSSTSTSRRARRKRR